MERGKETTQQKNSKDKSFLLAHALLDVAIFAKKVISLPETLKGIQYLSDYLQAS